MELRELKIGDEIGVEAISLVDFPAIEENFVFFSAEKVHFAQDEERQMLVGPALIPNKKIYRKDGDHEFEVFFSVETVVQAAQLYMREHGSGATTLDHERPARDVYVVESWLVADPTMDKAKSYGFDVPSGTWMVAVKVENKDTWQKVKEGKYRGFSIEGYFVDTIVNMENNFVDKILDGVRSILDSKKQKFYAEKKTQDGTVIATEADEFAVGVEVMVVSEEGQASPAPDGEHMLEDGTTITTSGGVIEAIGEPEEEMEEENKDEFSAEQVEFLKTLITDVVKEVKAQADAANQELRKEITELQKTIKETPAATVTVTPTTEKPSTSLADIAKTIKNG